MVMKAVSLASLLNGYLVQVGPPNSVSIPQASRLAKLQTVTLRGLLLPKQQVRWDSKTLRRHISLGKHGGRYSLDADGSLAFCIGVRSLQSHIICRIQNGFIVALADQPVGRQEDHRGRLLAVLLQPLWP